MLGGIATPEFHIPKLIIKAVSALMVPPCSGCVDCPWSGDRHLMMRGGTEVVHGLPCRLGYLHFCL